MDKVKYRNRFETYYNKPKEKLSDINAYNGISLYLQYEYNYPVKDTANSTGFRKVGILMLDFLKSNELEYKEGFKNSKVIKNATYVQKEFKLFKLWCKDNIKRVIEENNINNY